MILTKLCPSTAMPCVAERGAKRGIASAGHHRRNPVVPPPPETNRPLVALSGNRQPCRPDVDSFGRKDHRGLEPEPSAAAASGTGRGRRFSSIATNVNKAWVTLIVSSLSRARRHASIWMRIEDRPTATIFA